MKLKNVLVTLFCLPAACGWAVSEGLEDGSNNVRGGSVPFTVPDTLTGTLANDGGDPPQDYFSFTGTGGVTYQINGTSSGVPALDLGIAIENGAGATLAGSDTGNAGQPESFTFTPPSTNTYYLVAYRADLTATGASYSIAVSTTSGINDWNLY